ncbi:kinase-like domain, phloem protein 2-like protein [Tanacetum coccineum]|uniref:Kinase-like domain, phloem protein 2-like protein n=1 Tax=Tanacetum coccineum TaxID=301880 RepID=A0ABQ4ZD56_9ASTR
MKTTRDSKGKNLEHLKIRLSDILSATKNFSETYFLGSGGFAKVYRAELDHFDSSRSWSVAEKDKGEFPKRCSMVAIKRILGIKGKQGFFAEIEMLTSCKHQNIVSLLGYCDEDSHMILVYEYVSNGSLDDYLENSSKMTNFTWARRIRLCLNIANGLKYLHSNTEDKQMIVHRDIKSANILLNNNLEGKIADFGLSKLRSMSKKGSTLNTNHIAGTDVYLDPEYKKTGKLKKESDIYSFGVVLFEIMCGKVAYDQTYLVQNEKGLSFVVRRYWSEGKIKEMVDPNIQEAYENIFMINRGLSQDSLDTFTKIAYQCLAETQAERPTMEAIINELEKALSFEENHKDNLQISIEEINLATQNFSPENCVGSGRYWKAYRGEVLHANGRHTSIVAKRWESNSDHQFLTELDVLFKYKHENIIGLSGYCKDMDEKIIIYEQAPNGSLDKYLNNASLTWTKRLNICIDIARGLAYLHGEPESISSLQEIMHGGIKSANIEIDGDWKAKISNLHLSSTVTSSFSKDIIENVINDANDSLGYLDPNHKDGRFLTAELDIYALGVVLFEILCGRLAWVEGCEDHSQSLGPLAKCLYEEGRLDEIVFEGIKDQTVPKSLTTFQRVAYECLEHYDQRPSALNVMVQLEKALEFQEDYEIWEAKLPKDYKEIFSMSKSPDISTKSNKDLYDMLNKGILLQQEKVLFSLGSNGERNEMISARKFIYKKRWARKWRSLPADSRISKRGYQKASSDLLSQNAIMLDVTVGPEPLTTNKPF